MNVISTFFFKQIILFKNWFLGINIVKVEDFGFSFKNSGMFQRAKRRRSTRDGRVVDYSIESSAVGKLDTRTANQRVPV